MEEKKKMKKKAVKIINIFKFILRIVNDKNSIGLKFNTVHN